MITGPGTMSKVAHGRSPPREVEQQPVGPLRALPVGSSVRRRRSCGCRGSQDDFVRTLDGSAPQMVLTSYWLPMNRAGGARLALLVSFSGRASRVDAVVEAQRPAEPGTFEFASVKSRSASVNQAGMAW